MGMCQRTNKVKILVQRGYGLRHILPLHRLCVRQQDGPGQHKSNLCMQPYACSTALSTSQHPHC